MKFIRKHWKSLNLYMWMFLVPVVSFAQIEIRPCETSGKICNPLGDNTTTIPAFVQTLLEGALRIGIPVLALAIIYCGFLFVFARGNSEKLGKAKDALMYTLIGGAILLGALGLATLISNTVKGLS